MGQGFYKFWCERCLPPPKREPKIPPFQSSYFGVPRSWFKSLGGRSQVYETFGTVQASPSPSRIDLGTFKLKVKFSNDFSLDPRMLKILFFCFHCIRSKDLRQFACIYMIQGLGKKRFKVPSMTDTWWSKKTHDLG